MPAATHQIGFSQATLEPGVRYFFEQGRKGEDSSIFNTILNVEGSTKWRETLRNYSGLGAMAAVGHGDMIPTDTVLDGFLSQFTHTKYGKIVGIDRESIDDDQYGIVKNMGTLLADSVRYTKEFVAHRPYNEAFAVNLSDGVPLISASHPLTKAGGVASNILGTAADPSYAGWAALNTALITQPSGARVPKFFLDAEKIWFVHTDFYDVAVQAVESSSTPIIAGTGTTNANSGLKNPWSGKTTIVASPYLTDTDAHFLIAKGRHEGYMFVRRDANAPESKMEYNPEVMFSKVVLRLSSGFADWRGVVGSQGA
jgi:Mu-like prophage major head subunit gpT